MDTHFQKELEELKKNLLKMAALVEESIRDAVQSLVQGDAPWPKRPLTEKIGSTAWRIPSMRCA